MSQHEITFDLPSNGTATSQAAADSMRSHAATLRGLLLALLQLNHDGLTDEEAQHSLGMNPNTQRPRRGELVTAKLVIDSGETRATRSGRQAIIWKAVR